MEAHPDIAAAEQAKYDACWQLLDYRKRCHSFELWQRERLLFPAEFNRCLDIGCGDGRLFELWCEEGRDAWAIDISGYALPSRTAMKWGHRFVHAALWDMSFSQRFDVGVCCDVLEHIPTELVPTVLERIAVHCAVAVIGVANFPSRYGDVDLHLTMKPATWWIGQLTAAQRPGGTLRHHPSAARPGRKEYVFVWINPINP